MSVSVVVGLQWGDEGKGKVIDRLAEETHHVVRGQGGHNAGHTVVTEKKEYHFHLLPSAILHPHVCCYLGGGVVIHPHQLLKELDELDFNVEERFFISPFAHVILPRHIEEDHHQEQARHGSSIGTTGKGIGPCYTDKTARKGIRICELLNREFAASFFDCDSNYEKYLHYAKRLETYFAPVEQRLNRAIARGESVLVEGAQGTLLDVQYGTYPFVTSSSTTAGGVCAGSGIGPSKVKRVQGVLKAYQTRVGNGPFPTEMSSFELERFPTNQVTREIGTTTGRDRRVGWLDLVAAKFAVDINGVDELFLTKLDILSSLDEIKVCTGYELEGTDFHFFAFKRRDFDAIEPQYVRLKGWKSPIDHIQDYKQLPKEAKEYIEYIESFLKIPIRWISTGPDRLQMIHKEGSNHC